MNVLLLNPSASTKKNAGIYSKSMSPMPPLGIALLASIARNKGHTVIVEDQYANNKTTDEITKIVIEKKINLIGISCLTPSMNVVEELVQKIKNTSLKTHITLGNVHATIFAKELIKQLPIDSIIAGEGEKHFNDLLDTLVREDNFKGIYGIDNINQKTIPSKSDLNKLPLPAWDLFDLKYYTAPSRFPIQGITLSVQTSRGCPFSCDYCSQNLLTPQIRKRDMKKVVEEIEYIYHNLGVKNFGIQDAIFPLSLSDGYDFCRYLKQKSLDKEIKWFMETKAELVNYDLLKEFKVCGLQFILFGFESANPKHLETVNKKVNIEKNFEVVNYLKKLDIKSYGLFMIGFANETLEDAISTINLALKLDCEVASFSRVTPYPGTKLYEKHKHLFPLEKIPPTHWNNQYRPSKGEITWHLPGLSCQQINTLLSKAMIRYYLRPKMILRHIFKSKSSFSLKELLRGGSYLFIELIKLLFRSASIK
ncbi:MAG: cobalamin-dependent protein [Oligoflexia bacterium]|nr:cobalamin-dependent protein [Oligoflexia bacterium]